MSSTTQKTPEENKQYLKDLKVQIEIAKLRSELATYLLDTEEKKLKLDEIESKTKHTEIPPNYRKNPL